MAKTAIRISFTDRNVMEMLVAVRKLGFLQVIKQVRAFPVTAKNINRTIIKDPMIVSSVVKCSEALIAFSSFFCDAFALIVMI